MAACPWCKAAMIDASAPCPRCGRQVEGAPGGGGGGAVPDLDLPARPSKGAVKAVAAPARAAPAAAPAPAPAAARRPHGVTDDPGAHNIDADSIGGDVESVRLDLDLSAGPPLTGSPSAAKLAAAKPAGAEAGKADKPPTQHAAMDRRSSGGTGGVDPYEARALADYGDAPSEWWKAPLYAYRVLRRKPELKKLADAKRREADRAEGAAEDALLRYAELVRPDAERMPAFGEALSVVRGAEAVVRERDAVLASEGDAHKARQAQHDARIAELEAQLGQIQIEERQIGGELAEADTLAKRADARAKRAEIEVRNALIQAGIDPDAAGAAGPASPASPQKRTGP